MPSRLLAVQWLPVLLKLVLQLGQIRQEMWLLFKMLAILVI